MDKFLIDNFQITKEEAEVFSSSFSSKTYTKGALFVRNGETCNHIGFVKKGALKCVTVGNGKEVIDDFIFKDQFVTDYYSFLTNVKSSRNIVCIDHCSIQIINRQKLDQLSHEHSFVEQIARKVTEKLFISTQKKLDDLRLLSAEERYLKLLDSNKRIISEIAQYEIASYLNISPETVSRIRKKLTLVS